MGEQFHVPRGVTTGEDVELTALQLLGQVGGGGQGRVYELGNSDKLLYKQYHDPRRIRSDALARLVQLRQRRRPIDRSWLDSHLAWPMCRVISPEGAVVGFIMRRARYTWRDAKGKQRLTELQYLVRPQKTHWRQITQPRPEQRRRLALAMAELTRGLHSWDVVFGDISDANILWSVKTQPDVYVIDCDGMRIRRQDPVLDQADTPGWNDPLQRGRVAGFDADLYKTALGIARILCCDPNVLPGPLLSFVPGAIEHHREDEVRRLLAQAAGRPGERPDAARWVAALSD
jgi:DNA-binding helix-hairpin-helix protein with protein kinase domain